MEVPGKREDLDLERGSQVKAEEYCQPCGCDSKHVPAEGFCQTCGDYLCAECLIIHTKPRPLRNHVLLDKVSMPRSAFGRRKPETTCTIVCPRHPDKVIEFFCPAHNDGLCKICAVKTHKQCDPLYIPDVAEEYKSGKELAEILDTLNHLETDIKTLSTNIKESISSVKENGAGAIKEIRQFRKELNDYLDKKEQELVLATERMVQEDITLLQDLTDEVDLLKNETSSFMKQLKSVETELSDLFVTSKHLLKNVQSVFDRFIICAEKNQDIYYKFELGKAFKDLLVPNHDLGGIKKTSQTKDINYCYKMTSNWKTANIDFTSKAVEKKSNIAVKTNEDTYSSRITGIVLLSPNTLLLADCNNYSMKTVTTASNTILSRLSLTGKPWDIALLSQGQAAVTMPYDKKIQIISTNDKLSAVRNMNVNGQCHGISATKDILVVSFVYPGKINMINLQGNVLVSVKTDFSGKDLFMYPYHNTIVEENKVPVIHVSDWNKTYITKLTVEGQVHSTYTHENFNGLWGMTATGDGQLLVCNREKNTVNFITEGGNVIQTLLDINKELKVPESICYCAEQNMLYVSSCSGAAVQAFKFT